MAYKSRQNRGGVRGKFRNNKISIKVKACKTTWIILTTNQVLPTQPRTTLTKLVRCLSTLRLLQTVKWIHLAQFPCKLALIILHSTRMATLVTCLPPSQTSLTTSTFTRVVDLLINLYVKLIFTTNLRSDSLI